MYFVNDDEIALQPAHSLRIGTFLPVNFINLSLHLFGFDKTNPGA